MAELFSLTILTQTQNHSILIGKCYIISSDVMLSNFLNSTFVFLSQQYSNGDLKRYTIFNSKSVRL